jgi:signal peptidase II
MHGIGLIRRILWLLALIVVIVLLDQSLKRLMVDWIGPEATTHRVELFGSLIAFEYLENRGAAFGMFQQGTSALTFVSLVIVAVAVVFMVRAAASDLALAVCLGLIVGGAVGNAIDRIVRGYVVDYIAIGNFWKFNLADVAVTIGALLTFMTLWRVESATATTQGHDT